MNYVSVLIKIKQSKIFALNKNSFGILNDIHWF